MSAKFTSEIGPEELLELIQQLIDGDIPLTEDVYEQFIIELSDTYCKAVGCSVESVSTIDGVYIVLVDNSDEGNLHELFQ